MRDADDQQSRQPARWRVAEGHESGRRGEACENGGNPSDAVGHPSAEWPGQQPDRGAGREHDAELAGSEAILLHQAGQERRRYPEGGEEGRVE